MCARASYARCRAQESGWSPGDIDYVSCICMYGTAHAKSSQQDIASVRMYTQKDVHVAYFYTWPIFTSLCKCLPVCLHDARTFVYPK
jgi:hypothetical protein